MNDAISAQWNGALISSQRNNRFLVNVWNLCVLWCIYVLNERDEIEPKTEQSGSEGEQVLFKGNIC